MRSTLTHRSSVDVVTAPEPRTVGQLRAAGHQPKPLRQEIRDNLLTKLSAGEDPWPGLHGFADTVIPQVERALLAGHDVVLLGERGQGKTRLLRALVGLLDEWTPVIDGSELGELARRSRARDGGGGRNGGGGGPPRD